MYTHTSISQPFCPCRSGQGRWGPRQQCIALLQPREKEEVNGGNGTRISASTTSIMHKLKLPASHVYFNSNKINHQCYIFIPWKMFIQYVINQVKMLLHRLGVAEHFKSQSIVHSEIIIFQQAPYIELTRSVNLVTKITVCEIENCRLQVAVQLKNNSN